MPEFEFIVLGPPFSANSIKSNPKGHQRWKDRVREAARVQWEGDDRSEGWPIGDPIEIVITTFFSDFEKDVDNVLKPILDSLKQPETERNSPFPARTFALYSDDSLVYKLSSEKVDRKARTDLDRPSELLLGAFNARYPEFVSIVVRWGE